MTCALYTTILQGVILVNYYSSSKSKSYKKAKGIRTLLFLRLKLKKKKNRTILESIGRTSYNFVDPIISRVKPPRHVVLKTFSPQIMLTSVCIEMFPFRLVTLRAYFPITLTRSSTQCFHRTLPKQQDGCRVESFCFEAMKCSYSLNCISRTEQSCRSQVLLRYLV